MVKETNRGLNEKLMELGYEDVVIFDNPSYEDAFIGISEDNRAVYDYDKMAECLVNEDDMTLEDAQEFIDYNTIRSLAYIGNAPIVVYPIDKEVN